jgi:hypothetical protein
MGASPSWISECRPVLGALRGPPRPATVSSEAPLTTRLASDPAAALARRSTRVIVVDVKGVGWALLRAVALALALALALACQSTAPRPARIQIPKVRQPPPHVSSFLLPHPEDWCTESGSRADDEKASPDGATEPNGPDTGAPP